MLWNRIEHVPVMGQLMVLQRHKAMASPYTCFMCNCGLSFQWIDVSPVSVNLLPVQTAQDAATAMYFNCNATAFYNTVTSYSSWWSNNTPVATVNNTTYKGRVTGQSGGTAGIWASFTDQVVDNSWYPDYACHYYPQTSSDNGNANVVTVNVSGPANVPLRVAGSTGPNTMNLTATGTPSGGSYSWTTTSSKVTLANRTSATVTVTSASASAAVGDVPVKVTYTYNGKVNDKTQNLTVRKPTSLHVESDTTNPSAVRCNVTCLDGSPGCSYNSYLRTRWYVVKDQFGTLFTDASVNISTVDARESFSGFTSTCGASPPEPGSATSSRFKDEFGFCWPACLPGGPGCSASATQTITVNAFSVRTVSVTWSCSGVSLSP